MHCEPVIGETPTHAERQQRTEAASLLMTPKHGRGSQHSLHLQSVQLVQWSLISE